MEPFQTGISILVLDPDRSSAETTNALLTSCQYKVINAERAAEALLILSEIRCKIDIVLTEFSLPDMNGLEFVETALQIRKLPVIFLSKFVSNGVRIECMLRGAKFCYDKPLNDYPAKNLWQSCVLKDRCGLIPVKREMNWSPEVRENQQIEVSNSNYSNSNLEQNVGRSGRIRRKTLVRGRMPSSNIMNAYKKKKKGFDGVDHLFHV